MIFRDYLLTKKRVFVKLKMPGITSCVRKSEELMALKTRRRELEVEKRLFEQEKNVQDDEK